MNGCLAIDATIARSAARRRQRQLTWNATNAFVAGQTGRLRSDVLGSGDFQVQDDIFTLTVHVAGATSLIASDFIF